jgi:hypothetical protein
MDEGRVAEAGHVESSRGRCVGSCGPFADPEAPKHWLHVGEPKVTLDKIYESGFLR